MNNEESKFPFDIDEIFDDLEIRLLRGVSYEVCHRVLRLMAKQRTGALRFAYGPVSMTAIGAAIGVPETEFQAAMEDLLNRKIFVLETDGAVAYEPIEKILRRAKINRINGLRGGRPPKSAENVETSEPSGASKNVVPLKRARNGSARQASLKLPSKEGSKSASDSLSEICVPEFARRLSSIAGLDFRTSRSEQAVEKWLAMGFTPDVILQVVQTKQLPEKGIKVLHWYTAAIKAAMTPGKKEIRH